MRTLNKYAQNYFNMLSREAYGVTVQELQEKNALAIIRLYTKFKMSIAEIAEALSLETKLVKKH